MAKKSIKAKIYEKNEFDNTRNYLKFNIKYPEILNIILVSDGYYVPEMDLSWLFFSQMLDLSWWFFSQMLDLSFKK